MTTPSPSLNVAVTALDSYDYYRENDVALEDYMRTLLREEPTSPAMERGNRFEDELTRYFRSGQWTWPTSSDVDIELLRPHALQVEVERTYQTEEGPVVLRGRLDGVHAAMGMDYKTTGHTIDLLKYHDSYQWRCYLAMMPTLDAFRYDVFHLSAKDVVVDHKHLVLTRYPELEYDVYDKLRVFAQFVRSLEVAGRVRIGEDGRPYRKES